MKPIRREYNQQTYTTDNSQQRSGTQSPVILKATFAPAGWILLPLRLFLAITFMYAGLQKLTDPHFFRRGTPDYIGNQIIAFAQNTPLHALLMNVALPHAVLFGYAIALGELAIGLGTLSGFLFRPAAFFGMLLSGAFFLSASWHVFPYFYGSDIVFIFCWLTMLLNGPRGTGYPAFDLWLVRRFFSFDLSYRGKRVQSVVYAILVAQPGTLRQEASPETVSYGGGRQDGAHARGWRVEQQKRESRRTFLNGLASGAAGVITLGALGIFVRSLLSLRDDQSAPGGGVRTEPAPAPGANATPTTGQGGTPAAGSAGGNTIAHVNAVPKNTAVTFTLADSGDPGVLIHLPSDHFVAFDATCTHAGCQVAYDPTSHYMICPCHGATYDPAQNAAVLNGPAPMPLAPVTIHIDGATGAISV